MSLSNLDFSKGHKILLNWLKYIRWNFSTNARRCFTISVSLQTVNRFKEKLTFGWNAPLSPDPTVAMGALVRPGGAGSRGDIPGKPGI